MRIHVQTNDNKHICVTLCGWMCFNRFNAWIATIIVHHCTPLYFIRYRDILAAFRVIKQYRKQYEPVELVHVTQKAGGYVSIIC